MSAPAYTPAQRAAVVAAGHTFIAAGAGSGKTHTLVGKLLFALGAEVAGARAERPCELGEVAAITFTVAAAADLRKKLRAALRGQAARDPAPRWRRLVYEVDRARIGTIHGFCAGLLREHALAEGADPGFAILEAGEAEALRAGCARDALYAALERGDPAAEELAFHLGVDDAVRAVARAAADGEAAERARAAWCLPDGAPDLARLAARAGDGPGAWRAVDPLGARVAAAVLGLAAAARAAFDRGLARRGALDYDALVARARDLLARSPDALAGARRRTRWLFVDEFQDTDPAQRDLAYRLCGVDEALARPAAGRPADGRPLPGCPALCVVGDPKQSIYGFRRADVTVWAGVERDLAALGATRVALDESFRSRAPVLGFVNATFARLMGGDGAPVPYRALAAGRADAEAGGAVELLAVPDDAGPAAERRRAEARLVARRIRGLVDGGEVRVPTRDGDRAPRWGDVAVLLRSAGDVRTYEAELRAAGVPCFVAAGGGFHAAREVRDLRLLLTALSDPHDDLAWAGVLRGPWVGITDDALFRLRRASRGGDLAAAALDDAIPDALGDADARALAHARAWLAPLRVLCDRVPCAALLERALARSGVAAALLHQPGGDVALANVRKLVGMVGARPEASAGEIAEWLAEQAREAPREGGAALHTAGEDVVTVSTVHGAKGLEWPVVVLCDLERGSAGERAAPACYWDTEAGIGACVEDRGVPADVLKQDRTADLPGAYVRLRAAARAREAAEELRVWYVAATRAQERLVVCARRAAAAAEADPADDRAASLLLGGLALGADAFTYAHDGRAWAGPVVEGGPGLPEVAPVVALPPPAFAEVAASAATSARVLARVAPAGPVVPLFRRSATELMTFERSAADHRRSYLLGLRLPRIADASADAPDDRLDARTVGDVVHAILELDAERDVGLLVERELNERLGAEGAAHVSAAERARVRRLVDDTLAHAVVARLHAGAAVERELPFTWFVDVDGAPSVVHGAMDLVARVDGALEILDFKTSRLRPGDEAGVAARYDLQGAVYAAALGELAGAPAAFSLFFPETGREARTVLGAGAVATGRLRVQALLRGVARAVAGARL